MARLHIEAPGQLEPETVTLSAHEQLLVGRLPSLSSLSNQYGKDEGSTRSLAIASPNVSANHALAWSVGNDIVICDLDSRNGTWVRVPRGQTLRIPDQDEVQVRLASLSWGRASEDYPQPPRFQNGSDYGAGISNAIAIWLSNHGVPTRVWVSSDAPDPGTTTFRLSSGEILCVRAERTVDGSFHDRMAVLSRYVGVQNSLFSAEQQTRNDGMVLASPAIRHVHRRVVELALQSLPSLVLLGSSGTGKERLAHAFHRCLGRGGMFVAVNCATLTRDRIVVDLFGAEAGAYTDARRTMVGAVERADGGTLFLDEIGELPLDVQPMLLRFLETGEYQRMGGVGRARFADVRVVVATNRDLRRMAREGDFREDLFFRLALEIIEVPKLRERFADVVAYLDSQLLGTTSALAALTGPALGVLEAHPWPGNFRELVNLVRRLPRRVEPGRLDAPAIRRSLEAGGLSSSPPPSPPSPASHPGTEFAEWLVASASAFNAEVGEAAPTTWSEVTTFVELYLKPWALAHLAGLQTEESMEGISLGRVSEAVKADRGTVAKQLRRYFECKRTER